MTPDVDAYYKKLSDFVGGKENVDFWGALIYKAQLDFFGQAITKAATLDQAKVADVMRTEHFKTLMSDDTFFTNQILDGSCYAGQIGQWQNGYPAGHRRGREAHARSDHVSETDLGGRCRRGPRPAPARLEVG